MNTPRFVFLVHGLHMKPFAMWSLARKLRRDGFVVRTVSYPSVKGQLDVCAGHLIDAVTAAAEHDLKPGEKVAIVGHSLGGLVAARALQLHLELPVSDLVMLGSPYLGAEVAKKLISKPLMAALIGHPLRQWMQSSRPGLPGHVRVHTVVGTKSRGMGRLVHRFEDENDGTVQVKETAVPGAANRQMLPVSHAGMLFSGEVAAQVSSWLTGKNRASEQSSEAGDTQRATGVA